MQQHLQGLEKSIQELHSANMELAARERLMSELAFLHEAHLEGLACHEVRL